MVITANSVPEALPLSRAQLEIWMAQQVNPASPKYNIAEYIEIRGSIDEKCFEAALRRVVVEAEVLNFRFIEHSGEPQQISDVAYKWSMPTFDLSRERDPWLAAEAYMTADLKRPVDLSNCPLFSFALFKTASDQYLWYQRFHHIIMDGFSRAIFAQRVAEVYTELATCAFREEKKFSSYVTHLQNENAYLKSEHFCDDREYWLERFTDRLNPTSFSNSFAVPSDHFLRQEMYVSPAMVNSLRAIARCARTSWKQVIIAAVAAYAYRITGSSDIILTLPVLGRVGVSSRRVPAMVSNTLPLRLRLHSSMALSSLVLQVAIEIRQLLHHQRYRGEDLRRDIRVGGRSQRAAGIVLNIMAFDCDLCFGGHLASAFNLSNGPVDDLSVCVYERPNDDGLRIDFDANLALYSANELAYHQQCFQHFLSDMIAADSARPIGSINLLETAERQQILVDWNDTNHLVPESTLPVLFEQQVERAPRSISLTFEDVSLTYEELNHRANRLAHYLIKMGVGPEDIVGLAVERSNEMIVSLLAILKSGAAYLPLAPNYPAERLSFMIQDAKPVCLVTTRAIAARLVSDVARLLLDDPTTHAALAQNCTTNPTDADRVRSLTPLNAAYVIYTSGSIGTSKGVVVSHAGIPSLALSQIEHLAITAQSRLLQFISISFDPSLFDLCLSTLSGARLILASDEQAVPGEALTAFARKFGVTHLNLPAAVLNMMQSEELSFCPNLLVGGESSSPQIVEQWSKGRRMISAYGPTETTVCATMSDPLKGAVVPPLGRPIWNTCVYVLDAGLEPVPIGISGELYIAGAGLARGYLGKPGLTAERFIACPFGPPGTRMYRTGDLVRWRADGVLEFRGRADRQIKIRGFRIEPIEVEVALASIDGVAKAVVIPREIAGEMRLVAFVVAHPGETLPTLAGLRATISARLPDYMVPAHFVALDALPLTINGKVDLHALSTFSITAQPSTTAPPSDSIEAMLCRLFSEFTGTVNVGLDDNFFEIGGSSFGAITLVTRINKAIDCNLAVRVFFEQPTVRQLAAAISQEAGAVQTTGALRSIDKSDCKLPTVYLFPGIFGDEPGLGQFRASLAGRFHFVVIEYPDCDKMLASVFDFNAIVDACVAQIIETNPVAPVLFAAFSFGGYVAFETAQRLVRSNYRVHFLGLIDTSLELFHRSSERSPAVDRMVYGCPTPALHILRWSIIPLLPLRLAHFVKMRLCAALRNKYLFQWSPQSLDVQTTLFLSDDPLFLIGSDSTYGWTKVCPSLTVVSVGGDHETILKQPLLDLLCSCFIRAISSIQRPEGRCHIGERST
jgi:amino acid adenylation domain-containing protein